MFVQIIEGQTRDAEGLMRKGEQWQTEVGPGAVGFLGVTAGVTEDGKAITIARFESEAKARANGERPEQSAWWSEMSKFYEGDPTFTESSDVETFLAGGSNEAGFVQVMKSRGIDRERVAKLDKEFEKFAGQRPDLIGGLRIWTGPDSCTEVNYFTSESEARAGESQQLPADLQPLMAEFSDLMKNTEFLDLKNPYMH
jgi:hypothetical protein